MNKPCRFFKQGNCSQGAQCNFLHHNDSKCTSSNTHSKSLNNSICKNFKQGICRFGARCKFLHNHDSKTKLQTKKKQIAPSEVYQDISSTSSDMYLGRSQHLMNSASGTLIVGPLEVLQDIAENANTVLNDRHDHRATRTAQATFGRLWQHLHSQHGQWQADKQKKKEMRKRILEELWQFSSEEEQDLMQTGIAEVKKVIVPHHLTALSPYAI